MEKDYVIFNLKEALEQLNETIIDLENKMEYDENDFRLDLEHIYHHLNTSWNAKNSNHQEIEICTDSNFKKWRKFPQDLNLE